MTSTASFIPTNVHHQNSFGRFHYAAENHQHYEQEQQQQQPLQIPVNGIHIPLTPQNQMPVDSLAIVSGDEAAQRHILAERFKTKTCRNYEVQGFCPYESRCMFAHGDHELRTAAMNIKDGLFTEEAIKAFKRAQRLAQREAQQSVMPPPPAYGDAVQQQQQQIQTVCPCTNAVGCPCNNVSPNSAASIPAAAQQQYNAVHDDEDECCSLASGSCCEYPEAATTDYFHEEGNNHEYQMANTQHQQQEEFVQQQQQVTATARVRHNPYSLSAVYLPVGGAANNTANAFVPKMVPPPMQVTYAMP